MTKLKIVILNRKFAIFTALILIISILMSVSFIIRFAISPVNTFVDPKNGIIVIDPGHGGIDGGTNKEGIIEKEVNLDIGKKLCLLLQQKGYAVIMTREEDISLEMLDNSSKSRHQRDLNARTKIINNSNAQLFISIHVNCNLKKPNTDGAIVFYNNKYEQNKPLAYNIQRELNNMEINGKKRTVHDPVEAKYYVLANSNIPGVIVETAFISNKNDRQELIKETFRENTANAIVLGIEKYLNESTGVSSPGQ